MKKVAEAHSHAHTQPRISSFFSQQQSPSRKRNAATLQAPIDLTIDDDEPAVKKPRLEQSISALGTSSVSRTRTGNQWRFDPSHSGRPVENACPESMDEITRRRRHEEFKRVLLGENNPLLHRSLSAEDQSLREVEKDNSVDNPKFDDSAVDSDESDQAFKELTELFSHKRSKGKGRTSAAVAHPTKAKNKDEEIGPSGQPYTPSEKQACMNFGFNFH